MSLPINNYQEFFEGAKNSITEVDLLGKEEERLKKESHRLEKLLDSENKNLSTNIESTIKKRIESIEATYDVEIKKGDDRLAKVKSRRETAKNIGIKERIKAETAQLNTENKELKAKIKSIFKKNSVPKLCNTKLFYSLYFPNRLGEFIKLLLVFAICFFAIPTSIYLLLPKHNQWHLIIIYVLAVIIFGGIYITIANNTKVKYHDALSEGRRIYNNIHANNKMIKAKTKAIHKDKNEDAYDLASFDDEIAHINQELADIVMKKKDALNTFDTVTKNIITDELKNSAKPQIDKITLDLNSAKQELSKVSSQLKDKNLKLVENYEAYLGKEFMDINKINALQNIMNTTTVASITEAIEEYRNRIDE